MPAPDFTGTHLIKSVVKPLVSTTESVNVHIQRPKTYVERHLRISQFLPNLVVEGI